MDDSTNHATPPQPPVEWMVTVDGLKRGEHVMINTEQAPSEGDEILVKRDGQWTVVPWSEGAEGYVVVSYWYTVWRDGGDAVDTAQEESDA